MKTPLRYQITEFDCGTVSLLNAISYLYDREDIPSELVRAIYAYTLNCHDLSGKLNAMKNKDMLENLSKWITKFSKKEEFKLVCEYLSENEVNEENIVKCIRNKGVAFIKCYQDDPHYVIITNMNELNTYIFDPYFIESENDPDMRIIFSKPMEYNRIVRTSRIFSEEKKDFALGDIEKRECVLMNKKEISYEKNI